MFPIFKKKSPTRGLKNAVQLLKILAKSFASNNNVNNNRLSCSYELSQDLLDKQIEMLERKYGGVKARNAALTIQRAFRRYTLLKKFAAITAMAKAEKRLSRKLQQEEHHHQSQNHHQSMMMMGAHHQDQSRYHNQMYVQAQSQQQQQQQQQQSQQSPLNRPAPTRSLSLRERRHAGGIVHVDGSSHAHMPRSQSGGRCDVQISSHHQVINCIFDAVIILICIGVSLYFQNFFSSFLAHGLYVYCSLSCRR